MSLMNDALRKKEREQEAPSAVPFHIKTVGPAAKTSRRTLWLLAGMGVLVAIGGLGLSLGQPEAPRKVHHPPVATIAPDPPPPTPQIVTPPEAEAFTEIHQPDETQEPDSTSPAKPIAEIQFPEELDQTIMAPPSNAPPPSDSETRPLSPKAEEEVPPANPLQLFYQKARTLQSSGMLAQAANLYGHVLQLNPRHYGARFHLAGVYMEMGAFEQAISILTQLQKEDPANIDVLINLGISHIGRGHYQTGLDVLKAAQQKSPQPQFAVFFNQGAAYSGMQQYEHALEAYRQAKALQPTDKKLLFNLAVLYDRKQDYQKAVDYYERYLQQTGESDAPQDRKRIMSRINTLKAYLATTR